MFVLWKQEVDDSGGESLNVRLREGLTVWERLKFVDRWARGLSIRSVYHVHRGRRNTTTIIIIVMIVSQWLMQYVGSPLPKRQTKMFCWQNFWKKRRKRTDVCVWVDHKRTLNYSSARTTANTESPLLQTTLCPWGKGNVWRIHLQDLRTSSPKRNGQIKRRPERQLLQGEVAHFLIATKEERAKVSDTRRGGWDELDDPRLATLSDADSYSSCMEMRWAAGTGLSIPLPCVVSIQYTSEHSGFILLCIDRAFS